MKKIYVKTGFKSYPVVVGSGLIKKSGNLILQYTGAKRIFVITNKKIKNIYGKQISKALKSAGIEHRYMVVPDSEKSKSIKTWISALRLVSGFDKGKGAGIAAFGGGVVGDLAGFVAATYKRGVPLIQIPTSLLAQVDSSIGGKTAVDLDFGKNLVGAFYQPDIVISDVDLLQTLPQREIKNALAEIVKYAVILDKNFFCYLEKNIEKILQKKQKQLLTTIEKCSKLKAMVVAADETETTGYRSILNFGHTIGHAIETSAGYSKSFKHGEAVAVGLCCACDISKDLGILSEAQVIRIETLLKRAGLNPFVKGVSPDRVYKTIIFDKKIKNNRMRFVLTAGIGHSLVCADLDKALILKVIRQRIRK